jgi:hypothetical protein
MKAASLQAAEAKVREFDPADAALSDSYGLESQANVQDKCDRWDGVRSLLEADPNRDGVDHVQATPAQQG